MAKIWVLINDRSIFLTEMAGAARDLAQAFDSGAKLVPLPEAEGFNKPERVAAFPHRDTVIVFLRTSPGYTQELSSPDLFLPPRSLSEKNGLPRLTAREKQVLQMLADGLTPKQIAYQLGVCPATVRAFIRSLNTKIGAKTTELCVAQGVLLGLCRLRDWSGN